MNRSATFLEPKDLPHAPSMLAAALHTVARLSGAEATALAEIEGKALRHYGAGLRQYLCIRIGSPDAAKEAWKKLLDVVRALPEGALLKAPGERGQLYRQARELGHFARDGHAPPSPEALAALPWRAAQQVPAAVLAEIRTCLDPLEAELVELRHARELSPEEIAFVVGRTALEVLETLDVAVSKVQLRLARMRTDRTLNLRRLLLEAFALDETRELLAAEREQLPADTIIGGRYRLSQRLGAGAFGDVYLANDTEVPGHEVALKLLHQPAFSDEARQNALRELHLIASVFHPSVVQFKDHGWFDGRLWFVMPLYRGETLEARISRGALSRREAQAIFVPLARGLAAIHAAGIRHQDIKPENVFLARLAKHDDAEILPVLLDLGVAAKEAEMVIAGTPTYFAPEVAAQFARAVREKPRVTNSADVYSLALTLRNSLEPGTRPGVPAGAVEAFIEARATDPMVLPEARDLRYLSASLSRWLSRDPLARPSAEEFAAELDVLVRPERERARRRKLLRWLLPAAAALLLAFGTTFSWLHHRGEARRLEAERAQLAASALRESLRDSRQREEQLVGETGRLRESFAQSRRDGESLTDQLNRVATELSDAQASVRARQEELNAAQERVQRTESALAESQTRAQQLDQERARALEETASVRRDEARLRDTLADAQSHAAELTSQLASLRDANTQGQARIAGLTAQLAAEMAKGTRLAEEVENVTAARLRMEDALAEARRSLAQRAQGEAAPEPSSDAPAPQEQATPDAPPEDRAASEDVSIYRVIGAEARGRPSARARGRTIET